MQKKKKLTTLAAVLRPFLGMKCRERPKNFHFLMSGPAANVEGLGPIEVEGNWLDITPLPVHLLVFLE